MTGSLTSGLNDNSTELVNVLKLELASLQPKNINKLHEYPLRTSKNVIFSEFDVRRTTLTTSDLYKSKHV